MEDRMAQTEITQKENKIDANISGVWIFAEQNRCCLRPQALQLLAPARHLAGVLQVSVTAVLLGQGIGGLAQELIAGGADEVLKLDAKWLQPLDEETYTHVFCALAELYKPQIVLLGATSFGRSLAPRIATRLQTGLTADCTALDIDAATGLLLQTRPTFGGNLFATIICPEKKPQMATVRAGVFRPLSPDKKAKGRIISAQIGPPPPSRIRHLSILPQHEDNNIAEAKIVVAIGKGIGNAGNIALAKELALLLGGALASSRPLVDAGSMPYRCQVGQTGRTVSPQLYIACGISGAVQHQAGMSGAKTIVAINNDHRAPIFGIADYGIVGDCAEVLKELLAQIKKTP
jgi:electron transfer flavoprotein alpha subunit